jgi:type I pantothenate kinase
MAEQDLDAALAALVAERVRAAGRAGAFLVALAGGVAVGKSTLARRLADALAAAGLPVQVVATDGFLKPNAQLAADGLAQKKGFPETYDTAALIGFLVELSAGRPAVTPVYSHVAYDIAPGETRTLEGQGIVIVEGVNVLQVAEARALFGLSIYLDAEPAHAKAWYLKRLDEIIVNEPTSLIAQIQDVALRDRLIEQAWTELNLVNLRDHIAPTASYADVVVRKAANHTLAALELR